MQITPKQIETLYEIYCNKEEIREFSYTLYSHFMYDIYKISDTANKRLEKIHKNLIVPMVYYYYQLYNIQEHDVILENVNERYPGKVIKIAISGVLCNRIYSDLEKNVFNNDKWLYTFNMTSDGFVEMILK